MAGKRKLDRAETFAEMVGEGVVADEELPVKWCQPVGDEEYTDEDGVRWVLRGGWPLPWKRVQRLIKDPQVRVMHCYMNKVSDVRLEDRDELTARIRPYLDGRPIAVGDHTDFCAGEFKDDQRRSLLIVEESC
jgi:hypothetical protein